MSPINDKLALSQLEIMGSEMDVETLRLKLDGDAGIEVRGRILSGDVERTIEGASTVTISVSDQDRAIRTSGRLGAGVDINIDGLWFRLAGVKKDADQLTLTFEDREVAILRKYRSKKLAKWGAMSRAAFIKSMVEEVREFKIPFICPELDASIAPPTSFDKPIPVVPTKTEQDKRSKGIAVGAKSVTVKGAKATAEQIKNMNEALDIGAAMLVDRKILVCCIMTCITESSCINLPLQKDLVYGWDIGMFQQRPAYGGAEAGGQPYFPESWPATGVIATDGAAWYKNALKSEEKNKGQEYGSLSQDVQRSAFPDAYSKNRIEAERAVTAYGVGGKDVQDDKAATRANNQLTFQVPGTGDDNTQYARGVPSQDDSGHRIYKPEDTWSCSGRLADEVAWRRFMVSGKFYYMSEPRLFQSKPRMIIREGDPGIDWIDYDYTVGKRDATVSVQARLHAWSAPPGSVVEIDNDDMVDGRWLVTTIQRSLFSPAGTIELKKPRPVLPEPKKKSATTQKFTFNDPDKDPAADPAVAGSGKYFFPVPLGLPVVDEQVDMGWDFRTEKVGIGHPLVAMGDGLIGCVRSAGDFGPNYITLVLDYPVPGRLPGAGRVIYYGHCGSAIAQTGEKVKGGQPITTIHGIGRNSRILSDIPGHAELGWADPEDYEGAGVKSPNKDRDEVVRVALTGIGVPTYALFPESGLDLSGHYPSYYKVKEAWPSQTDCAYFLTLAYMWGTDFRIDPNGKGFNGSFTGTMNSRGKQIKLSEGQKGDILLWNPNSNAGGHAVMLAEDFVDDSTMIIEHHGPTGTTPVTRTWGARRTDSNIGAPDFVRSYLGSSVTIGGVGYYSMLAIANGECPGGADCVTKVGADFKEWAMSLIKNRVKLF